jgi:hypothetical protein
MATGNFEDSKDLNSIGKHCSLSSCNQLDFLPVKCDLCLNFYCKEHFSLTGHNCSKYEPALVQSESNNFQPKASFYTCSFDDCNQREVVQVQCEKCHKNYCVRHRFQVDHKCIHLQNQSETKDDDSTKQQKKEFKFELKQNVSAKNAPLAAKLALMKLKQTAIGPPGLPEESKFYCFVQYDPKVFEINTSEEVVKKGVYFSNKWPIGRCIEFLVDKLKLSKSKAGNTRLYLEDYCLDNSLFLERLVKDNSLIAGQYFDLKVV